MTTVIPLEDRGRLSSRRRLLPLVAVGAAHLIGRLPPRRIRGLLTFCSRRAPAATYAQTAAARRAVVAVSMRCAGHGCLPRSIATALLCRMHGTWPTWHVGARTQPWIAHAWVAAEGKPVDEPDLGINPTMTIPPGDQ